ncbi:MAG TPA: hypothetical protein DGT21_13335 [Armatimonadetes bacterium]|jgi:hypothetical protein|nr:hypothetical protein [Armatimonadota bacterium]
MNEQDDRACEKASSNTTYRPPTTYEKPSVADEMDFGPLQFYCTVHVKGGSEDSNYGITKSGGSCQPW